MNACDVLDMCVIVDIQHKDTKHVTETTNHAPLVPCKIIDNDFKRSLHNDRT